MVMVKYDNFLGLFGHLVSEFIKNYLISFYSKRDLYTKFIPLTDRQQKNNYDRSEIIKKNDSLDEIMIYQELVENSYEILKTSYTKAEEAVNNSNIDISFSGTTCVTLLFICKNIG